MCNLPAYFLVGVVLGPLRVRRVVGVARIVGRFRFGAQVPARPTGPADETTAATRGLRLVSGEVYADWEAVYRDNVDRIYRVMFAKVGNRADAEDLTAEVFLAALRPLRVSASVGEVRTYLVATARTVLAGHWRRTLGREITTIDDEHLDEHSGGRPEAAPSGESAGPSTAPQRAEAALAGLPEGYRRILELRFLDSYSVRDAAAELGVSVANAKVLQHRALRRAARSIEEVDR